MMDLRALVPWKLKKPPQVREFEKAAEDLCEAADSLVKAVEGTNIALQRGKCDRSA